MVTKKCSSCLKDVDVKQYRAHNTSKDKLRSRCNKCCAVNGPIPRDVLKQMEAATRRARRREKLNFREPLIWLPPKERKERRAASKKCASRKYRSQPCGRAKTLWQRAKSRAALKGINFSISVKWIQKRIEKGVCEVTGIKFNLECAGSKNRAAPSIDRKNVSLGYTPGNCRLVCWHFNAAKSEFSDGDVIALAKAIIVGAAHDRL